MVFSKSSCKFEMKNRECVVGNDDASNQREEGSRCSCEVKSMLYSRVAKPKTLLQFADYHESAKIYSTWAPLAVLTTWIFSEDIVATNWKVKNDWEIEETWSNQGQSVQSKSSKNAARKMIPAPSCSSLGKHPNSLQSPELQFRGRKKNTCHFSHRVSFISRTAD